ncbi:MAG: ATPase, T2SS/T4P/T4SS family [bacterium]|nr:ATPase, T2SS/T4P/T4SS family [bacterium]
MDGFQLPPLVELVLENGFIDEEQAQTMVRANLTDGTPYKTQILETGALSEEDLLTLMAGSQGTDVIELSSVVFDETLKNLVPVGSVRQHSLVPVEATSEYATFATADLVETDVIDELTFLLSREIRFVFVPEAALKAVIDEYFSGSDVSDALIEDMGELDGMGDDEKGIESAAASAPVIRFVNLVLYQAITDRASDIHIEPFEKDFKIRYRVDGALYEMNPPPLSMALPIISRIKVLANLNIAERRVPQDGRIALTVAGRQVDLRVSCLPTVHGESVVLRVLDRSAVSLDLENIGLPEDIYEGITIDIEKPNGIFIVTGPTGSGKTTTLYSCLRAINKPDTKILTAEEPVEYDIAGLVQVPINPQQGNTFAKVLRAFLRQDPDVIMVGEIRDLETAEIAVQAALTGHFVFSTLHTNDAAGAVTRLVDMNVAPYLISSTLQAVLAQRLVRTCCAGCKTLYDPDDDALNRLGLTRADIGNRKFAFGKGCKICNATGYKGRKGVFEFLRMSNPVREMINAREPTLVIREKARELGMRTMREDAIRNVLDAYTTVDEVLRYT